jgi:hypothetical protein
MKKLIFSSLVGLALVTFTGCTNGSNTETSKCQSGKCDSTQKCDAKETPTKCNGAVSEVEKCNS